MSRLLVFLAVLSLLAAPAAMNAAEKSRDRAKSKDEKQDENQPGPSEIRKKAERAVARKKDAATHTYHSGDTAKFIPAEFPSDLNDADMLDGIVLGWLRSQRIGLGDDLPAGSYIVYLRKVNVKWHVYYTDEDGHIQQRSKDVSYDKDKDYNPPSFRQNGAAIGYSHWEFTF
ncbi:MAG: hypothetical protein ACM359_19795 [Bacillota bacterium]